MRSPASYLAELQALLPSGFAWTRAPGAVLTRVLERFAALLARVEVRAWDLLDEADPRTTGDMLTDWERVLGLPEICTVAADTEAERRLFATEKWTIKGAMSPAFYIALVKRLTGVDITIEEFRLSVAGGLVAGLPVGPDEETFVWVVDLPEVSETVFEVGASSTPDRLGDYREGIVECLLRLRKPSHTLVTFRYG